MPLLPRLLAEVCAEPDMTIQKCNDPTLACSFCNGFGFVVLADHTATRTRLDEEKRVVTREVKCSRCDGSGHR